MDVIPRTGEPVSPTPPIVYEPRFWRGRIWTKGGLFEGIGFVVRCPYGAAMNLSEVLTRACARAQILRYTFGPLPPVKLSALPREVRNSPELRYEPVLERLARDYEIRWSA
jgi:hypothetical protein